MRELLAATSICILICSAVGEICGRRKAGLIIGLVMAFMVMGLMLYAIGLAGIDDGHPNGGPGQNESSAPQPAVDSSGIDTTMPGQLLRKKGINAII